MISLGDLSVLGAQINPDPDLPHDKVSNQYGVCLFYGRDCGEELIILRYWNIAMYMMSVSKDTINYIFKDNKWWLYNRKTKEFIDLGTLL